MIRPLQFLSLIGVLSLMASSALAADEAESKPIEPAAVDVGRKVSFEKDIRDILELNCVACHYEGGAESRLVVENVSSMIKGGKRGAGIVPGKPDESLVYLVAARAKQPHMPPLPNKVEAAALTPRELGLLRQWIIEGAESDGEDMGTVVTWQPIPSGMKASYAIALSPWADRVAASRANQLSVFDLNTGEEARLVDPALNDVQFDGTAMYPTGAAHRDFVHAVAFHPEGRLIASGGFRTVKLWSQPQNVQTLKAGLGAVAVDAAVNADKGLVAFGTQQNAVLIRKLADGSEVKKLDGHTAVVNGVALSADGTQVVSGSADKTVRVWSLESGQAVRTIETPAAILDLCLSADGAQIITAHDDSIVRVWTVAAPAEPAEGGEKPVLEIKGHGGAVTSVVLVGPQGQQIATGSADGTLRTWTLANGAQVRAHTHGGPVVSVAATPDGATLVSGSSNNVAKLWRGDNGQQIAELRGHVPTQRSEALAKDQAELAKQLVALADAAEKAADKNAMERADALKKATEAKDKATTDFDEQKPKTEEAQKKNDEAQALVDAAQKASDEAAKAAADKPDDAELKKAAEAAAAELKKQTDALKAPADELKKQSDELKKREETLKSAVRSVELAVTADEKAKVDLEAAKSLHVKAKEKQASEDEAFKQAQEATKAAEKPLTAVAVSTDGLRVATSADDGTITIWSTSTGKPLDVVSTGSGPARAMHFIDGSHLLTTSDDQHAIVWDVNPAWQVAARLGAAADDPLNTSASPFVFRVLALAFSPDGKLLATGGGDPSRSGELMLWDVEKRELVRTIEDAHSDTVFGIEFSRDGQSIVSGSADKFVKVHTVATGEHVRSFEGHTHHVLDVTWKADGSQIVSAGADNAIKVWNVETGEQIRTIANYAKQVTSIAFMGVGGNVVSCGGDKTVRFHTAANGSNYRNFGGGTDFMYAADASRDETVVVSGGEDGVIRVWNGTNGQVLKNFEVPAPAENAQVSAAQ